MLSLLIILVINSNITASTKDYIKVTDDQVTIYDNRDGTLKAVGKLVKGQTYPIISTSGNWHRIQFGNYYGYVYKPATIESDGSTIKNQYDKSSGYKEFTTKKKVTVYDNSSGALVPFGTINKGVKLTYISESSNWLKISYSNRVGYVWKGATKLNFNSETKHFKVNQDNVTIYVKNNGNLIPVGKAIKSEVYTRIRDYGNWHQIQFGDSYGYIYKPATEPDSGKYINNKIKQFSLMPHLFTAKQNLTVYDNSSGNLKPFANITKGTEFQVIADKGKWLQVAVANRVGYVWKGATELNFDNTISYFKVKQKATIYDNSTGALLPVGEALPNQVYKRVKSYGNWHQIKYGDSYGYIYKPVTEPILQRTYNNNERETIDIGLLITKQNVTVYDNTSGNLEPFANLLKGQKYPVVNVMGNWYEVNVSGRYGFVYKGGIEPSVMRKQSIVNPNQVYSYEKMVTDINQLVENYSRIIDQKVIGQSANGRDLHLLKLGNGPKKVYISGSTHAREWITSNLVMDQINYYSNAYVQNSIIEGFDVRDLLNKVTIYYVPMVNPDGVTLVQEGAYALKNFKFLLDINYGSNNFSHWKANARGVDLNRNYKYTWDQVKNDPGGPASQNFKGYEPMSEPEVKALARLVQNNRFETAISYHSSGEVIYWDIKAEGELRERSYKIATQLSNKTGYNIMTNSGYSGGYFEDWFMIEENSPNFTLEVSPHVVSRPVPLENYNRIWQQNDTIGLILANEALKLSSK